MHDQTKNTCICASTTFNCPLPPTKSNSPLPTVDRLGGALHTKHSCARNWTCGWLMIGHGLLRIHGDRVYSFHQLSLSQKNCCKCNPRNVVSPHKKLVVKLQILRNKLQNQTCLCPLARWDVADTPMYVANSVRTPNPAAVTSTIYC